MHVMAGVLAAMAAVLVACSGDSPGTADATGGAVDAAVDAAPGPGAIVSMSADAYLVPAGTDVTVSWSSRGATACTVRTSSGSTATGTSGQLAVRVDHWSRAVVSCEPAGRASVSAVGLARRCTGDLVLTNLSIVGDQLLGIGDTVVPPDACLVVDQLTLSRAAPDATTRVRRVGNVLFDMTAGANGLDLVALESAGSLLLDYQNGHFSLEQAAGITGLPGLDRTYLAFPHLSEVTNPTRWVRVASGRIDLRGLDAFRLAVATYQTPAHEPEVIEVRDGTTLLEVYFASTVATRAPMILGQFAGVTGDVTIRDNPALPHAEAMAFLAALGPVAGTTLVCNNLDDAPCPLRVDGTTRQASISAAWLGAHAAHGSSRAMAALVAQRFAGRG